MLKRDPTKPRAMEVLVERAKRAVRPTGLPLVGQVAAGEPILAEENVEEYLQVPDVIGGEAGDYILRVRGESMMDVGILDGDFVVVRPADGREERRDRRRPDRRDEATVKRFFSEKDHIRLQPENKSMKPIKTTRRAASSAASSESSGASRERRRHRDAAGASGARSWRARRSSCSSRRGRRSRTGSSALGRTSRRSDSAECPVCQESC